MQKRKLGRTGLEVSVLGYGAGAVGGLFTKGDAADQERAVARAIEAGINYFDTAALYGNGESEKNLGRVLKTHKANVVVGTKVRLSAAHRADVGKGIVQGMEDSLKRMGRDDLTVHGFRSSFRDWAAENTNYPRELAAFREHPPVHAGGELG